MKKLEFTITPDNVEKLNKNEIFVFGSNMLGNHAGGAALFALKNFGAKIGHSEGITGNSYAFPTLDEKMNKRSLEDIANSISKLQEIVLSNPDKKFLITEVGCGIAGFSIDEIAPLFKDFYPINNVSLPLSFVELIGIKGFKGFHKGMICGDVGGSYKKQYKENTVFEEELSPETCSKGMHFCQMPLDVFNYYPPVNATEYAEVVSIGTNSQNSDKISTNRLKVKGRIGISGLFKAHFEIIENQVSKAMGNIYSSENYSSTTGYGAHSSTTGNESISCVLGINSKTKASKGWIILVDWREDNNHHWYINEIFRAKVRKHKIQGILIQPDVEYWFENGELKF